MAAEEDKKFDAVLGGFLVNDLRARVGDLHCPESDTLAAYHERSLLPEEMNSWKEHIVGCARCQAILAELEATDSIPLQVSEKEEVLAAAPALNGAAAIQIPPRKEAAITLPGKSRVTAISRGVRWQWLAPAGALAAGLLVWIAWHENGPLQVKTPEIKTAQVKQPAAPAAARDERQAISAQETSPISKDQVVVGGVPAKPAPATKSLKQFEKSDSPGRVTLSESPADKETGTRGDRALDSLSAAKHAEEKPSQDAKAAAAGAIAQTQTVEVQTLAESAPLQSQQVQQNLPAQQNQLSAQKPSGPNPSGVAEATKKRKSESSVNGNRAPAAVPQPAPPPVMAYSDSAALRMAAAVSPSVIAAPGGKTFWRAGHAGMIEFSNDGGASWLRQTSTVLADLTAGSAPSDNVCWIVGRAGTILLTTDSGSHWATIHSPLQEDLGGVRATDALHATIWNLANTKVFETSDGGASWKPAASR